MQHAKASIPKFVGGAAARELWAKSVETSHTVSALAFNEACQGSFVKYATIELDESARRNTTIIANPVELAAWKEKSERIYLLVRDGLVMKIGGTRTGMKDRWGSYLCGHCVQQRNKKDGTPFPGKMSVTNAHLYHTIERDILSTSANWEIWCWKLPVTIVTVDILGEPTNIVAQTFHAYETKCIKRFKDITGRIPLLCDNSDPTY